MTFDELFFRMSQILERCKMSTDAAVSSTIHHIFHLREQHSDTLSWLQATSRQLANLIRQRLHDNPFSAKCHAAGQRAVRWLYAKCLPVLAELSGNSALAATAGFVVGFALRHLWGCKQRSMVKGHKMRGIVCQSHDELAGLFGLAALRSDLIRPCITSPDQVLIRVRVTSIDDLDLNLLRGMQYCQADPLVLGRDLVGEVEEVGVGVEHLSVGDRVWTARDVYMPGTMREYLVCPAWQVRSLPARLDAAGAATLPYSGLVALRCLTSDLRCLPPYACAGLRVFVSDGATAAGCIATQVLRAWGADVTVCVPHKLAPLARALGAAHAIPSMPDPLATEENCSAELLALPLFDAAVVTSAHISFEFCSRHAREVAVAFGPLQPRSTGYHLFPFGREERTRLNYDDLDRLSELVESGDLKPVLDAVFALKDFKEAFNHVSSVGKTVLKFYD